MRARAETWMKLAYPFGSEMPWDSTGQEEVSRVLRDEIEHEGLRQDCREIESHGHARPMRYPASRPVRVAKKGA